MGEANPGTQNPGSSASTASLGFDAKAGQVGNQMNNTYTTYTNAFNNLLVRECSLFT